MAREQELEGLIVAESLGRTVLRLEKVYCQSNPVLTALPTSSSRATLSRCKWTALRHGPRQEHQ